MPVVSDDTPDVQAADAWQMLAQAGTSDSFHAAWLEVLCRALADARAGLVLLAQDDGSFAAVAALPAARDLSYLSNIATEALRQREGVVRHDELGHARLAYPLLAHEQLDGGVVLDLGAAGRRDQLAAAAPQRPRRAADPGLDRSADLPVGAARTRARSRAARGPPAPPWRNARRRRPCRRNLRRRRMAKFLP